MEMSMVRDYQPYILNEDFIDYNQDKPFIKEDFIDFPEDKHVIKKYRKIGTCNAWVTFTNSGLKYRGVLYEVNDSSITLADTEIINGYLKNSFEMMSFPVNNIKMISTRRKKNAVRGVWIGAVSGFGASLLLGLAATRSLIGTGMTGAFYGIPFAAIGAGLGAIIASIPLGIPIHGDMKRYNSRKKMLKRRSLYR